MQAKISTASLAGTQQHQLCRAPLARCKRQDLKRAKAALTSGQDIGQTVRPLDHMQIALVGQPTRGGLDPDLQRRIATQGNLPPHILGWAMRPGAVIWRIGQNMCSKPRRRASQP